MCGIVGEFNYSNSVEYQNIKKMADSIRHRGPDGEGYFVDQGIGLGHRRLSIIDLSDGGKQPMKSMDGSMVLIFNGEIYNYKEIHRDLIKQGYCFVGSSDTEVVVNAIHCWGIEEALERFIGMFSFALWSTKEKTLYLARDRLGIKPLYYQHDSKGLIFASEPKALYVHTNFRKEISPRGVGQFFCFGYTLGEQTIFEGMSKLPAGHWLSVKTNKDLQLHQYWSIESTQRNSFIGTYEKAKEKLIEICESAFNYRLVSDVPVGVFLSGGVDSVFLSTILKKRLGADLEHITIGFKDSLYDESDRATRLANQLGLKHKTKIIDAHEAQNALEDFIEIWDEPFGDTSGIPTLILSRFAHEKVKVALSADGGDELFCGYENYKSYEKRFNLVKKVPYFARMTLVKILKRCPYKIIINLIIGLSSGPRLNPQMIARFEKMLEIFLIRNQKDLHRVMNEKGWTTNTVWNLLNLRECDLIANTTFESTIEPSKNTSLIDQMMRSDLKTFLGEDILTKVDRASMASSLECRDPFLDHRLVEFAFSLPLEYLYKDGVHKRILKEELGHWFTKSDLRHPKKGFSIPLYDWLRGPWKSMVMKHLSPESIKKVGILNNDVVQKELNDFYKYKGGRAEKIMLMLNFQMWANRWL